MAEQTQSQTLLLIFRKESPDLFHLLNETGLPISATSPLLTSQTQSKTLVVAPLLLVAVTEAMRANQDVFGGFEYLMSWTANDFRHFYVILEKRPPPKATSDDNNNDSSSSPWGDKPDDQKSNSGDWGDNNNNNNKNDTNNNNGSSNDQNGNSDSAWGDNNTLNDNNNNSGNDAWGAPPGSPVKDNSSNNAGSEFKNHEWPADMVNANNPNGNGNGNGNGRGRAASGASDWDVRDWARSPSEAGGTSAGARRGAWGGSGGTPTAPGSSKGKSGGW